MDSPTLTWNVLRQCIGTWHREGIRNINIIRSFLSVNSSLFTVCLDSVETGKRDGMSETYEVTYRGVRGTRRNWSMRGTYVQRAQKDIRDIYYT